MPIAAHVGRPRTDPARCQRRLDDRDQQPGHQEDAAQLEREERDDASGCPHPRPAREHDRHGKAHDQRDQAQVQPEHACDPTIASNY